ncbi:zinc finger protein 782 isoform X1 [Drosophila pseudoobscura]|uniref:Zinc finger protein 782 isoform X1 n=2 Tax=Drosophila pseudoobscura pseudoobscura TaxID=46245 RepID=A0A6I8UV80_DROPS|nr:zinc finger protein 782 isoform X1 [Drosophila pseudoobscura]
MVICGNILARSKYEHFVLSCGLCNDCDVEMDIERWKEFVLHIKRHREEDQASDSEFDACESSYNSPTETKQRGPVKDDEDCLAEGMIVDLPISSDEDEGDDEDSPSMPVACELEAARAHTTTDFSPVVKFNPTFYRRSPRITQFIELYRDHPCLWDPSDASYKNKEKRTDAYESLMEKLKASANIHLTIYRLKKSIASLHSQYAAITRQKKIQKLTKVPLYYHAKYNFLAERGIVEEGDSDDDGGDGKIKLLFTEENLLTSLFIKLYSKFPHLYDPAHKNFSSLSERKNAYIEITDVLSSEVPLGVITHYDVYDSILSLRQWYSRKMKTLTEVQTVGLSTAEKDYIERCQNFMPTKTFRQKLQCHVCEKSFSTDHALQAHQFKDHKLGDGGWFKCPLCELNFERRCHLQQHNQRVHMSKTFTCHICSRSFAFASQLATHKRSHDEKHVDKPYICEFCGKSFRQKIQLSTHVTAVHTKIRAFKCTMCPKDFFTKRDLKDHVKAHLNIRDKVCDVCQKAFTNANALVKHRHIHREKTLQCTLCSTRFSERVSLGVHMRRTHKIIKNTLKGAETTNDSLLKHTFPQSHDISDK